MPFEFRTHEMRLRFNPQPELVERVRQAHQGILDGELNLIPLLSKQNVLVFQSPTASTQVVIQSDRVDLTTRYFGDFVKLDADEPRHSYATRKLKRVFEVLDEGKVPLLFFGTILSARRAAHTEDEKQALRDAATSKLGIGAFTDGESCHDFEVRASRVVNGLVFENTYLRWFVERSLQLHVDRGDGEPLPPGPTSLAEWDIPQSDEGVEYKFDWNNKHSIFSGRRRWSKEDFLSLLDGFFGASQSAFDRVAGKLGG